MLSMVHPQKNRDSTGEPFPSVPKQKTSRSPASEWKLALGESVRRVRVTRNMSQEELADLIGATAGTISEIERGITTPSVATAWNMADKLSVSIDALVGRAESPWFSESGAVGHGPPTPPAIGVETEVRLPEDLAIVIDALQERVRLAEEKANTALATADEAKRLSQHRGPRSA